MAGINRVLFRTLWREEWRLHATLFGGGRFSVFPLVVLVLTAGAGVGLTLTGTDPATVESGIRALALLFGLYAGTAAFVGSDSLENLFDDLSLVLSTTETLPLSRTRLLGLFLLKDGLFYAVVFLLPVALGTAPLAVAATPALGVAALVPVGAAIAWIWIETVALFALGMSLTVAAIAARTRRIHRGGILGGMASVALVGWMTGLGSALLAGGWLIGTAGAIVGASAISAGALVVYDPAYQPPTRQTRARFGAVADRLGDEDGLVTKTLLDLARSSGGVWKPVVSAAVLLAVVAGLVVLVESIVGVRPAPGMFFGSVLALSAFTTYNWLTTFDALDTYHILPISVPAVFRAKRRAFVVAGLPAAVGSYVVALVVYPTSAMDAAFGAVLLVAMSAYFFGVTVYLAGFDPNEFLFDPLRFGLFAGAVAVVLIPTVIGSFLPAAGMVPTWGPGAGVVGALLVGAAGSWLAIRAGPRWETRIRRA